MTTTRGRLTEIVAEWDDGTPGNDAPYTPTDAVREWSNCRESEITADGAVWIKDPQDGHWLDETDMAKLIAWLESNSMAG